MLTVNELRIGNILSVIDEEKLDPSKVVSLDEVGLVQLESTAYPENIENIVGVPIPLVFFNENEKIIEEVRAFGVIILPFKRRHHPVNSVHVKFYGRLIKACIYIHELQNIMIELLGIDPWSIGT